MRGLGMRHVVLAVAGAAFVFAALQAAAATIKTGEGTEYVVPAGSPVHYTSTDTDSRDHFNGAFVLTGTYHYTFSDGTAFLSLTPDRASAARLPHWKERGAPTTIGFDNTDAAIAAIVPAAVRAEVKAHPDREARGHVSLDVDRFGAIVVCGDGNYWVRFRSVHGAMGAVAMVRAPEDEGDC